VPGQIGLAYFAVRHAFSLYQSSLLLVTAYAEWRRTGVAMGPNDTEPLDATR